MSNPIQAQPNPDDQTVPAAVEDTIVYYPGTSNVDWQATEQAAFTYRQGQEPGDKLDQHTHTVLDALNSEILSGKITRQAALESAQNMGFTTGPGAYDPPTGPLG